MMSPAELRSVIEEISDWSLDEQRRAYLANIRTVFGDAAENQLKDALKVHWKERKNAKEIA
jgi:hypothetical protein